MKVTARLALLLALILPGAGALATAASDSKIPSEAERLKALPDEDRKWLTQFVAPIILPPEKKAFLELPDQRDRDTFKDEFWKRREKEGLPLPMGPGYRERYADLRQLVETQYDHWPNDAARMVIRYGEPASINRLEACRRTFRDLEVWTYNHASGSAHGQEHYFFYRRSPAEARKMWEVGTPDSDVFSPGSCRKSFAELTKECFPQPNGPQDPCGIAERPGAVANSGTVCAEVCEIYSLYTEISGRQGSRTGGAVESAGLLAPPDVSLEGLDHIRGNSASAPDSKAKDVSVTGPSAAVATGAASGAATSGSGKVVAASAPAGKVLNEKEKIAALPPDERKWLTEFIAPIILPEEKKVYLELAEPYQRELFKEDFWQRRERPELQPPLGPGYRYRYEELRQLADEHLRRMAPGRGTDGAPVRRAGVHRESERLRRDLPGSGDLDLQPRPASAGQPLPLLPAFHGLGAEDVDDDGSPDRRLSSQRLRKSFDELVKDCPETPTQRGDRCFKCDLLCDVYRVYTEIRAREGSAGGAATEVAHLSEPPKIPTEGLEQMKDKWATTVDPKAKSLTVEGPSGTTTATTTTAAADAKNSTPAPVRRKLSSKEIKELTAKLDPKYKDWLTLVEIIITEDERQVFLQIGDNVQRDHFIEAFWKRRSFDAQGLRNDYRQIYTDRVHAAMELFHNLHNDRAKVFVLNGAPDAVVPIDCQDVFYPIQIWYYERLEAVKSKVYLIFYQPLGLGEYRLWLPLDGINVLEVGGSTGIPARRVDPMRCSETRTIQQAMSYEAAALGSGAMSMAGASKIFQPPTVETEGVEQILSMTTDLSTGATPVAVTKLVRFPEQRTNKIAVDLSLLVPKSDLKPRQLGEERFYNVDVVGEVVKDDRLMDNFKYRFDIPSDQAGGDKIPLTVRRYLYPGQYKLILKVSDGNQRAEGRITETLTVPEQPDTPPAEASARAQGRDALEKVKDSSGLLPSMIAVLPIAKEIVTGLQRFETKVAEAIKRVDFYLNGAKIMSKTRPPFEADLNLGPLPRKQTIRVVGFGESGKEIGEDEYIVNEGHDIFRVRILAPPKGAKVAGLTKVVAAVGVPEGKALQKLEFYSNETRVATLYQPPFEQTINIRDTKSLGYVRIVGSLDDGTVAEDLRYVNAPAYVSEVTVDAVELFATVTEKGRPVAGLQASNFKVFEDGVIQKVEQFESVKNLPLTIGVMVDTSASMLPSLPEAQKAAISFLDYTIGEKDRAFTISFDNEPYLLCKPTGKKDKLFRSLAGMRAEGSTALYDSIVYGLYQFSGVKGKKALIILTDGKDTASKFDFDTTLEYVRKTGISIYGIGLKIATADLEVKHKLNKLASVTGGQTFYIESAAHLEGVYHQINEELRSQYLLTYYSSNTGPKDQWRKVEVKVEPTSLQARSISGYYP